MELLASIGQLLGGLLFFCLLFFVFLVFVLLALAIGSVTLIVWLSRNVMSLVDPQGEFSAEPKTPERDHAKS